MGQQRGFTILELLLVVAIIMTVAALAIPNLLRSKLAAYEAATVHDMRDVVTAQVLYSTTYPDQGFADRLTKLGGPPGAAPGPNSAGLVDWVLGCAKQPCARSGYWFEITNAMGNPVTSYRVTAVPQVPGVTGMRGFCTNQEATITYDPAGGTSCTLGLR